jgi:quinol monooxygenase YgiN
MNITAVNTLEVRVIEDVGSHFESHLQEYATRFERAPGCVGYSVIRSASEPRLWVFSGCWSEVPAMTAHFESPPMIELVNHLMESCANLTFASFTPSIAETGCDATQ